jgi:hypothetical protein
MKVPHLNEGRVWDAVNFGIGLTLGFILVSGGIKLLDKAAGGVIPDEFSDSVGYPYEATKAMYGGETFNTLDNVY